MKILRGEPLEALGLILLTLGPRRGEVTALRWEDVDFDAKEISITHTLYWPEGGGWALTPVKTDSSSRRVAPPDFVFQALRAHKRAQEREKSESFIWQEHDFVFTTSIGTPLHGDTAYIWWNQQTVRSGIGRRRVHARGSLRRPRPRGHLRRAQSSPCAPGPRIPERPSS